MAEKKKPSLTRRPTGSKVSRKVSRVLTQARESLRVLETLEKETLAKARNFVRNPITISRKSLNNDKIAASLRSLGVATRSEVEKLERRIAALESELARTHGAEADPTSRTASSPDAFPNT